MDEKQDPIVNVGVKQSQKEKIVELIEKSDRYKSINEFVQESVSNHILLEYKKQEKPGKRNEQVIFDEINQLNANLIRDELLGFHKLDPLIIDMIKQVRQELHDYQKALKWDRIGELLLSRNVKGVLDGYIESLDYLNKEKKLGISESNIFQLKSLRDRFVHYVTAQEVKG